MPFDAAGFEIAKPLTEAQYILRDARAILDDHRRWTKFAFLSTRGAHCLVGAIHWNDMAAETLVQAIKDCGFGHRMGGYPKGAHGSYDETKIAAFNDHNETRYADVIAVLDRAYQLAA